MFTLNNPVIIDLASALVLLGVVNIAWSMFYQFRLSPVARFPGPPLPKFTFLYEFYYEWIRPGQYYKKIHEMHEQYGPIVRVSPEEIHISDPLFYHELFVPSNIRKTNAYTRYARGTGFEGELLYGARPRNLINHDTCIQLDIFDLIATHEGHKIIRDPVENLYSKISSHEPDIMKCAQNFCERLNQYRDMNKHLNLSHACLSLAIDVATTATLLFPSDYLSEPTFNAKLFDIQKSGLVHVPLFAHLPLLARAFTSPFVDFIASFIPELRDWNEKTRRQTFRLELREPAMKLQGRSNVWKRSSIASRIGKLIQQNGIFHVSHTIETVITHLAMNDSQRQSLKDEIELFWKEHPTETSSWFALRQLPYLTACIYKGLRLGASSMKRSPRVFPDDDIIYKELVIPKGTPISMTTYYMHMDPTVFPEPQNFDPERWLKADANPLMHGYLVPFGKGSRACAGQNIAWMQMYFAISQLYQPGGPEIELFESDETDVRLAHGPTKSV
ncbi:cytochrome P450 [Nemania sp. FL0031]|nr:cytochrome P450 [Nemania sp. FL0031]